MLLHQFLKVITSTIKSYQIIIGKLLYQWSSSHVHITLFHNTKFRLFSCKYSGNVTFRYSWVCVKVLSLTKTYCCLTCWLFHCHWPQTVRCLLVQLWACRTWHLGTLLHLDSKLVTLVWPKSNKVNTIKQQKSMKFFNQKNSVLWNSISISLLFRK